MPPRPPRVAMTPRDRRWLGAGAIVFTLIAGTCWYGLSRSTPTWREHEGVVVSRRHVVIHKQFPIRYEITIREASGDFAVSVSRKDFEKSHLGAVVHRDRFGHVRIVR